MSKLIKTSIILISVFLFGGFIGFMISDTSISDLASNENSIESSSQNLKQIDIDEYVNISNSEDINKKRQELINFIWKSNSLPLQQPIVESNFIDERFSNFTNLQKIEKISLTMNMDLFHILTYSYLIQVMGS